MRPGKIKQRILDYLAARPNETAFLRTEFATLAPSRSGVDKVLRALIDEGVLVRGGWGVVVRAEPRSYSRVAIPVSSPDDFAAEVLSKLRVSFGPTILMRDYLVGRTTQMPANLVYSVKSRIQRKIGFGKRVVRYERDQGFTGGQN